MLEAAEAVFLQLDLSTSTCTLSVQQECRIIYKQLQTFSDKGILSTKLNASIIPDLTQNGT